MLVKAGKHDLSLPYQKQTDTAYMILYFWIICHIQLNIHVIHRIVSLLSPIKSIYSNEKCWN